MIPFFKVSGAGNDFVAIPAPDGTGPAEGTLTPARIRAWCSRGLSVGADGLFLLSPADDEQGAVRMRYFNADGSAAALCINGTRCAARLAVELGWTAGDRVTVLTGAGAVPARHLGNDEVAIEIEPPGTATPLAPEVDGTAYPGLLVQAGVPHFVLPWPAADRAEGPRDLGTAPVRELGAALRRHPDLGPAGANVDFVHVTGRGSLGIRSYERGVEAETLACGTGVLAAVAAGLHEGTLDLSAGPVRALTRSGFELRVDRATTSDGAGRGDRAAAGPWTLAGDARLVARGELLSGAAALPAPPSWDDAPERPGRGSQ